MGSTCICPFCFTEFKKNKVNLACVNRNCKENLRLRGENKKFCFAASGINMGLPKNAKCPSCKTVTSKWACPKCNMELPRTIESSNDMIISIVGSRDAGKSNFVAVLVNELKRIFVPFGYSVSVADVSREDYQRRFGKFIYEEHRIVRRTESKVDAELDLPIICTIERRNGKKICAFTFSFMDSAGEDFNDPMVMKRVMPYISKSKGIILLIDPMQIRYVRESLSNEIVNNSSNVSLASVMSGDEIVNNVAKLVRQEKKCVDIMIPTVCSFSKIDTIRPLVSENSRIFKDSPHVVNGFFDLNDAEMVSNEVKSLLASWGEERFVEDFERKFKRTCFLPCSAFGETAKDGRLTRPHSLRIEDALLWILAENGALPIKKS